MLERTRREVAQPIDAATDAFVPAARPRVVAQGAAIHPRPECLACGEVPGLALRGRVELVVVDVMHRNDPLPHMHDSSVVRRWHSPTNPHGIDAVNKRIRRTQRHPTGSKGWRWRESNQLE